MKTMDAIKDALERHLDCAYAEWVPGLNIFFQRTVVVKLWRTEKCFLAGDPPRYVEEGYLPDDDEVEADVTNG